MMKPGCVTPTWRPATSFAPAIDFLTAGGSDDIVSLGSSAYRLFMNAIPADTIFTLTVSNITDAAGNPVTPAAVTVNDDDDDAMADDWELRHWGSTAQTAVGDSDGDGLANLAEFQRGTDPRDSDSDGDGMPDGWEVTYSLDPLVVDGALDPDIDTWTNFEEFTAGTSPQDPGDHPTAAPPQFAEIRPATGAAAVPSDAGVCVRILSISGVNTDDSDGDYDPDDLIFTITVRDAGGAVVETYTRNLDDAGRWGAAHRKAQPCRRRQPGPPLLGGL